MGKTEEILKTHNQLIEVLYKSAVFATLPRIDNAAIIVSDVKTNSIKYKKEELLQIRNHLVIPRRYIIKTSHRHREMNQTIKRNSTLASNQIQNSKNAFDDLSSQDTESHTYESEKKTTTIKEDGQFRIEITDYP